MTAAEPSRGATVVHVARSIPPTIFSMSVSLLLWRSTVACPFCNRSESKRAESRPQSNKSPNRIVDGASDELWGGLYMIRPIAAAPGGGK